MNDDELRAWLDKRRESRGSTECGTNGGYQRHVRNKEKTCRECKRAHRDYSRARRAMNPEKYEREKEYARAQTKALWRLAAAHRDEFRKYTAEEVGA